MQPNSENFVLLKGVLAADPDLRKTAAGIDVANISLLVTSTKPSGETDTFIVDVAVWGRAAVEIGDLGEGDDLTVKGRLVLDRWERDGESRQKLKVTCDWWA